MSTTTTQYPFDPTGKASTNLITGERQVLTPPDWSDFYFIIPTATPYFLNDKLKLVLQPSGKVLQEGVDFNPTHRFYDASKQCASPVYGSITFLDRTLSGIIEMQYQTLGGDWTVDSAQIAQVLANTLLNPRTTTWEEVVNVPYQFPPVAHAWDLVDMTGGAEVVAVLNQMVTALLQSGDAGLAAHLADFNNPHKVTKAQVGLGSVQNYPIASTAEASAGTSNVVYMTPTRTKTAIDTFALVPLNAHVGNTNNPHSVTKAQVGLSNVDNYSTASTSDGIAGSSNKLFMTPVATASAISSQALTPLNTHIADHGNPHLVTKAQVGLGNVEDYPMATNAEALAGTATNRYMSPATTLAILQSGVGGNLQAHIDDHSNPHQVTKEQVGLGSVENFPIATDAQATAGSDQSTYMTPYLTGLLVDGRVGSYSNHLVDYDNPHHVTKTQVGLSNVANYPIATIPQAQAATANDVYMTPATTKSEIIQLVGTDLTNHIADKDNPHEVTAAQVGAVDEATYTAAIAALTANKLGKTEQAADAATLEGTTLAQIYQHMGSTLAFARFSYSPVNPTVVDGTTYWEGPTWSRIVYQVAYSPDADNPLPPIACFITGGEGRDVDESPVFYLNIDPRHPDKYVLKQIAGKVPTPITFGYSLDTNTWKFMIYMGCATKRNAITLVPTSDPGNAFSTSVDVVDAAPAGLISLDIEVDNPKAEPLPPMAGQVRMGSSIRQALVASHNAYGYGNQTSDGFMVHAVNVATTAQENTDAAASTADWVNEWHNFERIASFGANPITAGDRTQWGWDNTAGALTLASAGSELHTLLSPEPVPSVEYGFEVTLSSSDLADDALGVCLGYFVFDGRPVGLWAMRTPGATILDQQAGNIPGKGAFDLFTVGLNLFQDDGEVLASSNAGLTWGDGVAGGTDRTANPYVPNAVTAGTNGWQSKGPVKIKFTLTGGVATIETTDFGSAAYVDTAKITFNLTDAGLATRFANGQHCGGYRWGPASYKQASASFKVNNSPNDYNWYVDYAPQPDGTDTSVLMVYAGDTTLGTGGWVAMDANILQPGRMVYSALNHTTWLVRRDGTLVGMPVVPYVAGGPGTTQILTT